MTEMNKRQVQLMNEFQKIHQSIIADLQESNPIIYHYTDYNGLDKILSSRTLRLTDYRYLNDPTELVYGQNIIKNIILESDILHKRRQITERSAKLLYRYQSVGGLPARLKIEINTTEHFQVLPLLHEPFSMESEWFNGQCKIATYEIDELIATKLRALYQRRKGRDLFDLWLVIKQGLVNTQRVVEIFQQYCANDNLIISRALFERNLDMKRLHKDFQADMNILLPNRISWNFDEAFEFVLNNIITQLQ